jgi:uncharacterized protein YecT (DUF1311 family)
MVNSMTAVLILLSSLGGTAAERPPKQTACESRCGEAPTELEPRQCFSAELAQAHEELDRVLAAALEEWELEPSDDPDPAVRERLDAYSRAIPERLREAQDDWRQFMTSDCAAVGAVWTNGSGRAGAELVCRLEHVRRRAHDLWTVYLEGDAEVGKPCVP